MHKNDPRNKRSKEEIIAMAKMMKKEGYTAVQIAFNIAPNTLHKLLSKHGYLALKNPKRLKWRP